MHFLRRESIERFVESRADGNQLPLKMRRQFGDRDAVLLGGSGDLVAIGLRGCRFLQIE